MNSKKISMSLLAISVITAAGFGLYRLGMSHAASQSPSVGLMEAQAMTVAAPEDPSSWGIPEGERATRRHMESGLKAGDTDPLTDRRILYYHDPMVPGKKFDSPAKSPFMDMMLVPAYSGGEGSDPGTVTVSPRIQQNLGGRRHRLERTRSVCHPGPRDRVCREAACPRDVGPRHQGSTVVRTLCTRLGCRTGGLP